MELFDKMCKKCQQFKNIKTLYGHLPPKNIAELKPWYLVHVDLIGPYSNSIRQHQPGGAIVRKNFSLTFMKIIDPTKGWFEIVGIPMFNLHKVTASNDEYIDKLSDRVSQLFKYKWLFRYPRPRKVMFDNQS